MLKENELASLLYKPQKEIPGVPAPEASNRAQTLAGLDKLDVNHMMVIKAKDHPYVHQWNNKNSPKKCKVKRVGLTEFKVVKRLQ
jgi:hypothetical protein|tara:strand:+ start:284 stop:538 length:255 start_codon:yes stop_codon:yes gene_type:complete